MAQYFDPSFEGNKRKVRPQDSEKTIDQENDKPPVLPDELRKLHAPFRKNIEPRRNQRGEHESVEWTPIVHRGTSDIHTNHAEPLGNEPRSGNKKPSERNP